MPNPYFRFKRFTVYHDRCAMKVGTDGVLLGATATHDNPLSILDIGAGSGVVSLMLAQRFPAARITGIEIDGDAAGQAAENAAASEFSERISISHQSLAEFPSPTLFDLIVSNPPFFGVSSTSKDEQRNLARQTGSLSPDELLATSANLLNENGRICIIFPAETALEPIAAKYGLYLHSRLLIRGNPDVPVKRVIFTFGKHPAVTEIEELVIEQSRGVYTAEFTRLLNNFYLYL